MIRQNRIIVVCRKVREHLLDLAHALLEGGLPLVEVTFDQEDPACEAHTAESLSLLRRTFGRDICLGAGTVLSPGQARVAAQAGAEYVVSPHTDEDILAAAHQSGLFAIPGALTPNEILTARRLGADAVKLFPAMSMGLPYIRDLLAPLGHIPLVAAGGITEENLPLLMDMGLMGAGISTRLTDPALLQAGDFAEITRRARTFARIAEEAGPFVFPDVKF